MAVHVMRAQRGAALLIAMIILALVATLASAMVWQQWRAVQVETAERARAQSSWVLSGAGDWARLILREDKGTTDNLSEVWAVPLQEARLSTFLAADKNNTDDGPDAFLSGRILDAQARYNLRNLAVVAPDLLPAELKIFVTLLENVGIPNAGAVGSRLAASLRVAFPSVAASGATQTTSTTSGAYLPPQTIAQLAWFGVDDDTITRMTPYFIILPTAAVTTVNINTAPKEVLAAVAGVDAGTAQQWVQRRVSKPFENVALQLREISPNLSDIQMKSIAAHLGVSSGYFEVHGRLRLGDRVLEDTSLLQRASVGAPVVVIQRRRESLRDVTQ